MADERTLQTVAAELKAIQDEHRGKPMPEAKAAEFERLAKEAKEMQDSLDRDNLVKAAEARAGELKTDLRPRGEGATPEKKGEDYVGYVRMGDLAPHSEQFKRFVADGMPKSQTVLFEGKTAAIQGRGRKAGLIPVTKADIAKMEAKAVPDIGARVIPFDRDPDGVVVPEYVQLRIRDVLNVVPTDSNSIEWWKRSTYTRGAATQTESTGGGAPGAKGEAASEYELVTTPVRTHAVHMPVTEQQLSDWPQLSSLINQDLFQDLGLYFEEQVTYGDGTGTNFLGFFQDPDVLAARTELDDTLIDQIRRGITDVRRAQGTPNAVVLDPIDWEGVVLEKGSDEHYIWAVVTEAGQNRIWGLPVVETVKAEDSTGERNVLIGDFGRGATVYDRMSATLSSGWINDQFIRNARTLLLEARAGFAIRRPAFFRKIQTNAYS